MLTLWEAVVGYFFVTWIFFFPYKKIVEIFIDLQNSNNSFTTWSYFSASELHLPPNVILEVVFLEF